MHTLFSFAFLWVCTFFCGIISVETLHKVEKYFLDSLSCVFLVVKQCPLSILIFYIMLFFLFTRMLIELLFLIYHKLSDRCMMLLYLKHPVMLMYQYHCAHATYSISRAYKHFIRRPNFMPVIICQLDSKIDNFL